jgi:hypothetical protein
MKRRAKFCRYVPAVHGSPAWMTVKEADKYLKKEQEYIQRMIEYSKHSPRDLAFWESKVPRIEYVEDK